MRPHSSAIRYRRRALNMSLRTLSAKTGIHRSHLSRVERGLAGLSDTNIEIVADALGVTPNDITHKETP
ncbi:helix-turn-helix domain-containing protein [Streptomyces sp. 351MFTsu5.1]|uniref:helix-turn-helix domain-containing protein n=1 Tax=Streptomyces sp. 351MFTsu5.1 TaxID=1172180 RepID=UPI00048CF243|nr:helix-turn-helix transcriptional regulator [Streptomyces sp. 351MFTsu5.1]